MQGGFDSPLIRQPLNQYKMKVKFNHDAKETTEAFGITDHDHVSHALANTLSTFLQGDGVKTMSKLGEHIQESLSDNEILLLATQQVHDIFNKDAEFLFKAFIEHLKRSN